MIILQAGNFLKWFKYEYCYTYILFSSTFSYSFHKEGPAVWWTQMPLCSCRKSMAEDQWRALERVCFSYLVTQGITGPCDQIPYTNTTIWVIQPGLGCCVPFKTEISTLCIYVCLNCRIFGRVSLVPRVKSCFTAVASNTDVGWLGFGPNFLYAFGSWCTGRPEQPDGQKIRVYSSSNGFTG